MIVQEMCTLLTSNNRIQVFTPEGQFLRKFGSEVVLDNWGPNDIAIDNDTVYVIEYKTIVFPSLPHKASSCDYLEQKGVDKDSLVVHMESLLMRMVLSWLQIHTMVESRYSNYTVGLYSTILYSTL